MLTRALIAFAVTLTSTCTLVAQTCDCPTTFAWMVTTFEENDAGFQLVVDRKGTAEYAKHTEASRARVAGITDLRACTQALNDWLQWFRHGHIGIEPTEKATAAQQAGPPPVNGGAPRPPGRTIKVNEAALLKQWSKANGREPVEGIWSLGAYRLAVTKDATKPGTYAAVILSSTNPNWKPGEVKAEFAATGDGFAGTYFMGDHSPEPVQVRLVPGSGGLLEMNGLWVRELPPAGLTMEEQVTLRTGNANTPFLERLSDRTLYLRIPSFAFGQKVLIDSVLAANDTLIRSTENFIIDIRNGTGGSDASYAGLIPYLCSGPMRSVGVKLRATELNAAGYEAYADMFGRGTEDGRECLDVATRMRAALNTWLEVEDQPWTVDSSHAVLPFPLRVGIICNGGNGSTDEQFLLDVRTSAKVKLFGHPTMGSIDVSNMRLVTSPDGCFELGYTMSMSHRLPTMPMDVMGVQPDHYLDGGIPVSGWVSYVRRTLEWR
ncbi:MAG: hypothetical protein IPJ76_03550 [Flavobacteriales bacterium]|nr:MAG: hypothetical protein IPJ76_03550 [Flavobacteriales bacterium]